MTFGEAMRQCRTKKGFSIEKLAKFSGISYAMICFIEQDKRNPSLITLEALADTLDVSLDEYVGWNDIKGGKNGKRRESPDRGITFV